MKPRVCAVRYLNTTPLVWGLLHGPQQGLIDLTFEEPARCADALRAGQVDIGLVPVIELARQPLERIPGLGIASEGAVRSILLASQVPAAKIRTVAADENSRTSVVLAAILLREKFGAEVRMAPWAPRLDEMLARADAGLVIGDAALRIAAATAAPHVYDLGEVWTRWTGLPMVYAVWAARAGFDWRPVAEILRASWEFGRVRISEIAEQEGAPRGIPASSARDYLTENIRFVLSQPHEEGLARFQRLAEAGGLV